MAQTILFQNKKKTTINQQRSEFITRLLDGVGQDSNAPSRVSAASAQPLTAGAGGVTPPPGTNSDRVPNYSTRGRTVLAAGWVPKPISWEIDRIAKESGLTRSRTIATLLEEAVHQRLHTLHAVMLSPLVRKSVVKGIKGLLPL